MFTFTPLGRRLTATALAAVAATTLAACSSGDDSSSGSKDGGNAARVALLLPEDTASRYEAADAPYFTQKLKSLNPNITVDYRNAKQDAAAQLAQATEALDQGAKVLVLTPVDSAAAAQIVTLAKAKNVPVISYDRLVLGVPVDYYISFDNAKVGELQGNALLKALGDKASAGSILWINGSPTDNNATLFKRGAHQVLDGKVKVAAEFDTPDWKPANAKAWAEKTLAGLGSTKLVGVYAANDGTAGAAIAALKAAGYPAIPVTGQDAEVAALQRLLSGEQNMTVYKAIQPEAEKAAELAFHLLAGDRPTASSTVDNKAGQVPSFLLDPVSVTRDQLSDTVIRDGFVTVASLCAGSYAQGCSATGIG
jgi:D-xylose transport system substrate-binding protein